MVRPRPLEFVDHRGRETILAGTALAGEPLDGCSAGIAQPQEVGDLVERLARGVVQRLPQQAVVPPFGHVQEHRMPTTHQKRHKGGSELGIFQGWGKEMPFQVIDPDKRTVEAEGEGLPIHHSHEQRSHQSGARCHRNPIQLGESNSSIRQRLLNDRADRLHVGAAGELRNDSTEDAVDVLREDDERGEFAGPAVRTKDGRGGLVARGLDTEDPIRHD